MDENSESENIKDENETKFFEENNLYISGKIFKQSLLKINKDFDLLENIFKKEEYDSLKINDILSIDDIKINSLEEDVQNIIKETTSSISDSKQKNKKIFVLKNDKEEKNNNEIKEIKENIINDEENNTNKKKVNYLRNEAKVLEETISKLNLTDYQTLKKEKFKNCNLNSLIFFKDCKKEIGKENNYIFNYRDNFLNDMTKIDQLFFQDYFKPNPIKNKNNNLIYEFSIYHPLKNIKTQQISILGDGVLKQLKEKIYCVIDEIQNEPEIYYIQSLYLIKYLNCN